MMPSALRMLPAECSTVWCAGSVVRPNKRLFCSRDRFGVTEQSSMAPLRVSISQWAVPLQSSGKHSGASKLRSW